MDSKRGIPAVHKPQGLREKSFPRRALIGPCGIFIVCVLFLALLYFLVFVIPTDRREVEGCAGKTVYLDTVGGQFWSWEIGFKEHPDSLALPHLSDIYLVPSENVKMYTSERAYVGGTVFQSQFSKSSGQLFFLYQIESLVYTVTASSGNATTTNGELLIFDNYDDYYNYSSVPDKDYLAKYAVFRKSFPIGTNNTPIRTDLVFNQSSLLHTYYYLGCTTPPNITISFYASVKSRLYNYKDYGQKNCSIKQNPKGTNSCVLHLASSSTPYTAFAYVNEDPNLWTKPLAKFSVVTHRRLPLPILLVIGGVLLLAVVAILMYIH